MSYAGCILIIPVGAAPKVHVLFPKKEIFCHQIIKLSFAKRCSVKKNDRDRKSSAIIYSSA
jgi:hypothetical protein